MKKLFTYVIILLIPITIHAQQKAKVLVLGAYHMGNPGLDAFNMKADDVMVPKRQKEIEEFVALLAAFKPTKICLEASLKSQQKLNENYQAYVSGNAELKNNESEQIGFRLAKQLGHSRVFAIDAKAPFDMDTVVRVAQKYQFYDFLNRLQSMSSIIQDENKKLYESTITQFFQYINSDTYVRLSHSMYLEMAAVGKDENYSGADLVADWYKRNLRIYRNLLALNPNPEDRILIIYGAGHTKILQDLVDDSSTLQLIKLSNLN
jgi:hypothetical protein